MMGRGRSFLILLAIAVGLGAYIYFVEMNRTPGESERKPKVFTVEADKIQEVTVKAEAGDRTTLAKTDGTWKLTAPVADAADQTEISGITSNLASLEVQDVVDENPPSLKEFGLDTPRIAVEFKAEGDQTARRLEIGGKTATGGDLYARLGSEARVFTIPAYLESTFNRSTFELRDKTILRFERDKADTLEIVTASHTARMVKQDAEWNLTQPVEARADYGTVEGLIGRLASGQMKALTATEAADLAQYGLEKPATTVRLGSGSAMATLAVGKEAGEGELYARDLSRPIVFTVESSLVEDLTKGPGEFRRKDLFEFRPFNATKLEIVRGGETLAFEKVKPPADAQDQTEKWRQTAPSARDVDTAKMDALLSAISNLRAQSFADTTAKTGLDRPELTVTASFDEGKQQEKVAFGKSGSDVFAARSGEPGAARVDTTEYENAIKALEGIKT